MATFFYVTRDGARLNLREPSQRDAGELMRFINGISAERMSGITMDRRVTLKQEQGWLQARLNEIRARWTVMLVVEGEGKIVGSCQISRRLYKESHRASIGIALSREWRARGVGEALMRQTIELARTRMPEVETLELSYLDYNKRASRLYEKLGFVRIATIPRSVKEGSRYFDEHMMTLRLRTPGRGRDRRQKR